MRKFMAVLLTVAMLLTTVAYAGPNQTVVPSNNCMPPNEEGIANLLVRQGVLDQDATDEEVFQAVKDYVNRKMTPKPTADFDKKIFFDEIRSKAAGKANIKNMVQGNKNGKNPLNLDKMKDKNWKVHEKEYKDEVREIKLLVLLAEFGDDEYDIGPLHNEIEAPGADNNSDFWVNDFSKEHYEDMLFTEGGYDATDQNGDTLHLDSMTDYYINQSNGSLKVAGDAYGWFELPYSEAYYGDDSDAGHDDLLPGTSHDLVADLLKVAKESGTVPFEDYDIEDPYDLDGDTDYDEPDGIIDHLVLVHAGVDQSGGGGAQGDNAIWAHSSSVFEMIPSDNPTTDYWDGNMLAYNYTIQGEDGTIGVFCHETGHDLGLPDEYDTIYSGNGDPVGFYSLMSSGSWVGKPLGTKPAPMSPWGRITLGEIWGGQWVKPTEVSFDRIKKGEKVYKLDETTAWGNNNQVVKVNLPQKLKETVYPYEGEYSFFGGKGDEMDNKQIASLTLPSAANIFMNFQTSYDIEEEWDFGFIQVSTDNGATWTSLESPLMTSEHASQANEGIIANLPGYSGYSDGWVSDSIDLTDYAGQNILLSFRYMTDAATSLEGFYVDDISVVADGNVVFSDNAENGEANWTMDGWMLSKGYEMKNHYYLIEWRSHNNTDEALKYCYNYPISTGNYVDYFQYEPAMLLWYRDTAYDDNWVGLHPGKGFLSVVDSHAEPLIVNGRAVRTRIQIHDAAFSLDPVAEKVLTLSGNPVDIGSSEAIWMFDDSQAYWYATAPHAGVKVPKYGIKIEVQRNAEDYSVGEIRIFK
jgi:immune inhibitor A